MNGIVTQLQRFSVHDGPGIRTTVFMKGCNLHCLWCHNPETLSPKPQLEYFQNRCAVCGRCIDSCNNHARSISGGRVVRDASLCVSCFECEKVCVNSAIAVCGKSYDDVSLCDILLRDSAYYEKSGGGVTFSGGEPLLQPEFVFRCADTLRGHGIDCAVETACNLREDVIRGAAGHFTRFMCDVKAIDPALHKRLTGVTNERILSNIRLLATLGVKLLVRVPVAMTLNGTDENISATADFLRECGVHNIELLKLHRLAEHKYSALGLPYTHPDIPETTDFDIEHFYSLFGSGFTHGF